MWILMRCRESESVHEAGRRLGLNSKNASPKPAEADARGVGSLGYGTDRSGGPRPKPLGSTSEPTVGPVTRRSDGYSE
jgi:hypothetical protein